MVKLTEDMVIARSKGSELHNIKKLNCWGSELSNVAVVRKLPNVEVLSLSVNQISTLEDFQYCINLQELYIRKNNIADINEVLYLRQIPKLKSLWLADNPCAEFPEYRMTVLRALPHLQKFDNTTVEPEDVQKAMVCGLPLPITGSREPALPESQISQMSLEGRRSDSAVNVNSSGYQLIQSNGAPQTLDENHESSPAHHNVYDEDDEHPPMRRPSAPSHMEPQEYVDRNRSSHAYSPQISPMRTAQSGGTPGDFDSPSEARPYSRSSDYHYENQANQNYRSNTVRETDSYNSSRKTSRELQYKDQAWANDSDGYIRDRGFSRSQPPSEYRALQGGDIRHFPPRPLSDSIQHYEYSNRRADHHQFDTSSRVSSLERPSPQRPYPLRPKTRTANVLSAVLCLIKELDYSSLEVAEMAIRCRMDELDD